MFCKFLPPALALLALAAPGRGQPPAGEIPIDPQPRLAFAYQKDMRFGLTILKEAGGKDGGKRLTFSADGDTNGTNVRIDGKELELGGPGGRWLEKDRRTGNRSQSSWSAGGVRFTQILEIVPSRQPVDVEGMPKRVLDTLLVRWVIESEDGQPHNAGLRLQLDTLIGGNDGVPFTVPGKGLVSKFADFRGGEVPEFIQCLERPDLQNPGTVGNLTLKLGGAIEAPGRVSLTYWPGGGFTRWDVPVRDFSAGRPDSAVVLYWAEQPLAAAQKREIGFAYGLGRVSAGEGTGRLALTANGAFEVGRPFTLTAYVHNPREGQTLTLELPEGLERSEGQQVEEVPPATGKENTSIVTWKITANNDGRFKVRVRSSTGAAQTQPVTITPSRRLDPGPPVVPATDRPAAPDTERLTGDWVVVSYNEDRKEAPAEVVRDLLLTFTPDWVWVKSRKRGENRGVLYKLDSRQRPKTIDFDPQEPTWPSKLSGIYEFVGDQLRLCLTTKDRPRPTNFSVGANRWLVVLKRAKGEAAVKGEPAVPPNPDAGKVPSLTVPGKRPVGEVFAVTAEVVPADAGLKVTLHLPPGLTQVGGEATQTVAALPAGQRAGTRAATWQVKGMQPGSHSVRVATSTGAEMARRIAIEQTDPNAGKFTLAVSGPRAPGQVFTLTARVSTPPSGLTLTLVLPPQLALVEGTERQTVVPAGDSGSIAWKVKGQQPGQYTLRVQSSLGQEQEETLSLTAPKASGFSGLDVLLALRMSVREIPMDLRLDLDGDGEVTSLDAAMIARQLTADGPARKQ